MKTKKATKKAMKRKLKTSLARLRLLGAEEKQALLSTYEGYMRYKANFTEPQLKTTERRRKRIQITKKEADEGFEGLKTMRGLGLLAEQLLFHLERKSRELHELQQYVKTLPPVLPDTSTPAQ